MSNEHQPGSPDVIHIDVHELERQAQGWDREQLLRLCRDLAKESDSLRARVGELETQLEPPLEATLPALLRAILEVEAKGG